MALPLYKFIADPDALAVLLKGIVRFTPIPELNDPSELVPTLNPDEVRASLERLRRDGNARTSLGGHRSRNVVQGWPVLSIP